MVMFNNCINVDEELLYNIEAWSLDLDEDTQKEIFQYFAISESNWEYLASKTDMPLFYSEKMNLHIIGIDFLDNWDNVDFEI
jgi:DNA polymerase III delta subunit